MLRPKAYTIVITYALASALWILLSDKLVGLFFADSVEAITQISMFKGWFYVGVMSAMLFVLLRRHETKVAQQHEAVQKSETRLTQALNATNDGLWDWDLVTDEVYYSPSYWRMLDYDPEKMRGASSSWAELLHPEDKDRTLAQTFACIENSCRDFSIEFRMRTALGGWKWILARGNVVERDANGRALRMIGTHVDMTERKRAEEALRESETTLRALKGAIPDLVWVKDVNSVFVTCNPVFERLLGVEESNIVGRRDEDFLEKELADFFVENDRRAIAAGHPVRNEEWLTFADNGYRGLFETIKTPMRDSEGNIIGVLGIARDMTERRDRELEIQRWMQRFSIVNAAARQVFYDYDLVGDHVSWKGATQDVLGIAVEALNGPVQNWVAQLHPDDAPELLREMDAQRQRCGRFEADYRWLLPGGGHVHIHENGVFLPDETGQAVQMLGVMQDVTERMEALERLHQSEERFSSLFRLSPDSIVLMEMDSGSIVDVNETFLKVHGYAREELLGKSIQDLGFYVDDNQRQEVVAGIKRDGHVTNKEVLGRTKTGQHITFSLSSQQLKLGDKTYRMSVLRDISDMKKMQEMMVQTEKMISVGGIAAGIAHEINNPLGIVLQAAQNLVQRTLPDFKKNLDTAAKIGLDMKLLQEYMQARKLDVFIQDIQSAAVRASSIIRHMLDFSRHSESRRKVCDVTAIIDRAVVLASSDYDLKKSYDFKRIKIERDFADELPSFNCTETEIEQVLLNLLRNAAQALATVEPPVQTPVIGIRVFVLDGFLRIELGDNGPGMPQEIQRRVFEPFFTTKPPGVGTGLGLSVSYFIVTKGHGGRMSVSSQPGAGTTFVIELPLDPDL